MLLSLPRELISLILLAIDIPQAFFNVIQTCKLIYSLGPIKQKRVEFLREVEETDNDSGFFNENTIYTTLPNGKKEGNYSQERNFVYATGRKSYTKYNCRYINDIKEGQFSQYTFECEKSNTRCANGFYKNGELSGPYSEKDGFGRPIVEINYEDGSIVGLEKSWYYYSQNDIRYIETIYSNEGKKIREVSEYDIISGNKTLRREYSYVNDDSGESFL